MEARLKSEFWVKAQLRLLDQACISAVIGKRGDPDAGAIYLKIIYDRTNVVVLSPSRNIDGEQVWIRGTGNESVSEPEADAYLSRQMDFDPDIWVLEIEDPKEAYQPDRPIIS